MNAKHSAEPKIENESAAPVSDAQVIGRLVLEIGTLVAKSDGGISVELRGGIEGSEWEKVRAGIEVFLSAMRESKNRIRGFISKGGDPQRAFQQLDAESDAADVRAAARLLVQATDGQVGISYEPKPFRRRLPRLPK